MEKNLAQLTQDTLKALRQRSFSERNPHLGKMRNCRVCGNRHRATVHCTASYATHDAQGNPYYEAETPMIAPLPDQTPATPISERNAIIGRAAFARKRWFPHQNLKRLHITPELRARRLELRTKARRQANHSRRINAGLATPGSRP
jgi:hypothetical protein